MTLRGVPFLRVLLALQAVLFEFLAQRGPVYAQNFGRKCLITIGIFHDCFQQRGFYLAQHQLIDVGGFMAVQVLEIGAQSVCGEVAKQPVATLYL